MINILIAGNWMMIPLLACSILLLAVILERRKSLEELTIDTRPFRERLSALLRSNDVEGALKLCGETPGPVAGILGIGVKRYRHLIAAGRAPDVVEEGVVKAMEDYAPHVVARLEKYLPVLATIGTIAPLMGFLGTVTGMIGAFQTIAAKGGMTPATVAGGISEALITTATGLVLAIPAFVAYNYFTSQVRRFVLEIEESSTQILEAVIDTQAGRTGDAA